MSEDGLVLSRRLRDVGILTEKATEIAPYRGNRIASGDGVEVIQRLLFNRVHILGDEPPVDQGQEGTVAVFTHSALASFPRFDPAELSTKKACDLAAIQSSVKHRLFHVVVPLGMNVSPFPDAHHQPSTINFPSTFNHQPSTIR